MKPAAFVTISLVAVLSYVGSAHAQVATIFDADESHTLEATFAFEQAFTVEAGYGHAFRPSWWDRELVLTSAFELPVIAPDSGDWQVAMGGRTSLVRVDGWDLTAAISATLTSAETRYFDAIGLGVDVALVPGYQSSWWGVAAELGVDKSVANHVSLTDAYRETIYDEARDGWYASGGGLLRVGAQARVRMWCAGELQIRGGYVTSERLSTVTPPFYFSVGTAHRF